MEPVQPSASPPSPAPLDRWERLAADLLGGLSPEERAEMERWMSSDPGLRAHVGQIRETHSAPQNKAPVDIEHALGKMTARLQLDLSHQRAGYRGKRRSAPGIRKRVAVTVLAGATACLAIIATVLTTRESATPLKSSIYQTAMAEQATMTLADGSEVILAPDSRITLEGGFGDRTRTLSLTGEAFFVVRNTSGVPFIVRTGDVQTRVLGTSFGIRAYSSDSAVRVTVMSGKVESEGPQQSLTLTAGTVGEFTDSTVASSRASDMDSYVGWTRGQLVFENVAAGTMLTTIGRWYGYTFRVTDSTLAERRFSAVLNLSERAETMLLLERLLNVNMQVTGEAVIVHPRSTTRRGTPPPRRIDHNVFSPSAEVGK